MYKWYWYRKLQLGQATASGSASARKRDAPEAGTTGAWARQAILVALERIGRTH